jgi:hypothetical protein
VTNEEIMQMLDAIHAKKPYVYKLSDVDIFEFKSDRVKSTYRCGHGFTFDDVETARNLAGALIVWANVQEDYTPTGDEMAALVKLAGFVEWPTKHHPVNQSRAEWYAKMTPLMSIETLKRNKSDLRKIALQANKERDHATLRDANRALDFIHYELKQKGACEHDH